MYRLSPCTRGRSADSWIVLYSLLGAKSILFLVNRRGKLYNKASGDGAGEGAEPERRGAGKGDGAGKGAGPERARSRERARGLKGAEPGK